MQVSGIRPPEGQIAHMRIGKRLAEDSNEGLIELDVIASEEEPEILEFEVLLEMPASLDFRVVASDIIDRRKGAHYRNALSSPNYMFTHSSESRLLNPVAPQMFDEEGNGIFSCVLLDWIEWVGPLQTEAERATRDGVLPDESASAEIVARHLKRFAERAWRRPVGTEELEPYLRIYDAEREEGEGVSDALKIALAGILTSRHFTYLVEGSQETRRASS